MARKNPVPQREKETAARLREIRKEKGLTMTAFAHMAGVPHVRYVDYEYGRVPLTYVAAAKICECFKISQRWLAEGKGRKDLYFRPKGELFQGKDRIGFTSVYDDHLREPLESLAANFDEVVDRLYPLAKPMLKRHERERREWRRKARAILLDLIGSVFDCTAHPDAPENASRDFAQAITNAVHEFAAANPDLPVVEKSSPTSRKKK